MSNNSSSIPGSRSGPIQVPSSGVRPSNLPVGGARPRNSPSKSPLNPFDLNSAFQRLQTLLGIDSDTGPRGDVPARGFYLNILV